MRGICKHTQGKMADFHYLVEKCKLFGEGTISWLLWQPRTKMATSTKHSGNPLHLYEWPSSFYNFVLIYSQACCPLGMAPRANLAEQRRIWTWQTAETGIPGNYTRVLPPFKLPCEVSPCHTSSWQPARVCNSLSFTSQQAHPKNHSEWLHSSIPPYTRVLDSFLPPCQKRGASRKKEPPLRRCFHETACRQCRAFPQLMIDVEGPSTLWTVYHSIGGPWVHEKAKWASQKNQVSKQHFCISSWVSFNGLWPGKHKPDKPFPL